MNGNLQEKVLKIAAEIDLRLRARLENDELFYEIRSRILEKLPYVAENSNAFAEAIVLLAGRPVAPITNGTFSSRDLGDWSSILDDSKDKINDMIRSVGRIEFKNHPGLDWGGTGWLLDSKIVVTNRHVASEVARIDNGKAVYRDNFTGRSMAARLDLLEEAQNKLEDERDLNIIYISDKEDEDFALFEMLGYDNEKVKPIKLRSEPLEGEIDVCVVGYPAWDGRRNDPIEMARIFSLLYNVKRIAPGKAHLEGHFIQHDCSTLGGNSGSVVFDIKAGEAVGLHFAGQYLRGNYAVPANIIIAKLKELGIGGVYGK